MDNARKSALIISLDFELHWGMADQVHGPEHPCWNRFNGVRIVVPRLLEMFEERSIHATWAAVGFLFARGRHDMERFKPKVLPQYARCAVNNHYVKVGESEKQDPLHFAPSLIEKIKNTSGQELASHTFSHYYCDEPGQDIEAFRADLEAAQAIAARDGIKLRSLVFPRNQIMEDYLSVLPEVGLDIYRGNPPGGAYHAPKSGLKRYAVRALRLADSYLNLTGHHTFKGTDIVVEYPFSIQASQFLRPYSRKFHMLEPLRRRRVIKGLRAAARRGEIFHLWWHPHNFGSFMKENLEGLAAILQEFELLRDRYDMQSLNMAEACNLSARLLKSV